MDVHQTSRMYGMAQTILLLAFTGVFFLDVGPVLALPEASRVAGNVLCAAGILLMAAAFASLRGAIQVAPEPRQDARLVSGGVYRRFRHPIYTAIVIVAIGLFLRKPTVAVAVAAAVVIAFLLVKVRFEEALLQARYPEYAEYRDRTWGLIPWFRRSS
jgi:protein-S-isoprenylcysteine O-methyltransferase Ste14